MSVVRPLVWTVLHLAYGSLAGRVRLLTRHVRGLDDSAAGRPWFFADVPVPLDSGRCHGLEVAIGHEPGDPDFPALAQARLAGWLSTDLLAAARLVPRSLILEPGSPLGRMPAHYVQALVLMSARAIELLDAVGSEDGERACDTVVREELRAIYRALVPDAERRQYTRRRHAQWLEEVAAGGPDQPAPHFGVDPSGARPAQGARPANDHHRQQAEQAAVVARLVHMQVVRLWGPERPRALRDEADLVRNLE